MNGLCHATAAACAVPITAALVTVLPPPVLVAVGVLLGVVLLARSA